jgi:hypothetical protein
MKEYYSLAYFFRFRRILGRKEEYGSREDNSEIERRF